MRSTGHSLRTSSSVITASGAPPTTGRTCTSGDVSLGLMRISGRLSTCTTSARVSTTPTAQDRTLGTCTRYLPFFASGSIQTGLCPQLPVLGRLRFCTGNPTKGMPNASAVSS